jgi:hypothetical protein
VCGQPRVAPGQVLVELTLGSAGTHPMHANRRRPAQSVAS